MGSKLTVVVKNVWDSQLNKYVTYQIYAGESWIKALWYMWRQKGNNAGVVKLEWR
jgi:hypothetical protein